ncbi:MAG: hypothetical protein K6U12_14230, partial [Armatimonadetes bacterium]|nr:hypothetical protein [Armatimonadota bacterium]
AREYSPRTARWLQRDPIDAASGDPNLYRYCGDDPINGNAVGGLVSSSLKPATAHPEGIIQPERWWQPDELPILRMECQRLCLCGSLQPALG